jgi:hypothetical protein
MIQYNLVFCRAARGPIGWVTGRSRSRCGGNPAAQGIRRENTTMKVAWLFRLLLCLTLIPLASCEVNEEKIELWKGTQQGPKKLAGTLIDPSVAMELRAKAGVALVEINNWDLFRESFQKMEKADSDKVALAIAPLLEQMMQGDGAGGETLAKEQVDAKDGLFIMYDYTSGPGREAVLKPLIAWCADKDYNIRAMAGQYNVRTIVKKLGAPAAESLSELLAIDLLVIEHVAKLIREVGDKGALEVASTKLAGVLKANVDKIEEVHLVSAAIIGGTAVADTLLDLATDKKLNAELQRFALRAFSQAVENENIAPSQERIDRLFGMGENVEYDRYQREETYLTIAQAGSKQDAVRVRKLLVEEDFFWRLVGLRCLLRMDGEGQLEHALAHEKLITSGDEISEVVTWVAKFPKLLPKVRELTGHANPYVKGFALYVLGAAGEAQDVALLEGLAGDRTKLPKGFQHGTVGEAAKAIAADLAKKG